MPDSDPPSPTSVTLEALLGVGFRATLEQWQEILSREIDTDVVLGLNLLGQAKYDQARTAIESARARLFDLQNQVARARESVSKVKEVLEVRKIEAEYKSVIVGVWPYDTVAERVSYLGTGILAAGGAAYALSGYPPISVSTTILPTFILWGVGLGLLIYGIIRLVENQRLKFDFFRRQFKYEIEGKI